jgi:hypothetical protein
MKMTSYVAVARRGGCRPAGKSAFLVILAFALGAGIAGAQDFGFGPPAGQDTAAGFGGAVGVDIGGSVTVSGIAFPFELQDWDYSNSDASVEAKLVFDLSGDRSGGRLAFRLDSGSAAADFSEMLDEAWLEADLGSGELRGRLQAGLMKASWGRADSLGVLDVLNPRDLRDLSMRDELEQKIAVPMLKLSQPLGGRITAELAYIPFFEGNRIAVSGPWVPTALAPLISTCTFVYPDMKTLEFGQAGARLNAGFSGFDVGLQYFHGYLTTPAFDLTKPYTMTGTTIPVHYNLYDQAGADLAFTLLGTAFRLEGALNLTGDEDGSDPFVYNRHLAWSAGFDRSLFAGITLNVQAAGKYRLDFDSITSPLDVESGKEVTDTQLAGLLSRSFVRDTVKVEVLGMMNVETLDYLVEPGLVVTVGDAEFALRGRWFAGDEDGTLGQFHDRSYARLSATYRF